MNWIACQFPPTKRSYVFLLSHSRARGSSTPILFVSFGLYDDGVWTDFLAEGKKSFPAYWMEIPKSPSGELLGFNKDAQVDVSI